VTSTEAPAAAENGLFKPLTHSPFRAFVNRVGSSRIGTNIGASNPNARGPERNASASVATHSSMSDPPGDADGPDKAHPKLFPGLPMSTTATDRLSAAG